MNPFWLAVIFVVVGTVCIFGGRRLDSDWGIALYLAAGLLIIFAILVPSIIYGTRYFGRVSCNTFAAQTGRDTKFVLYNNFDTGDCLTPTADGKWIPTSSLREFGEQP